MASPNLFHFLSESGSYAFVVDQSLLCQRSRFINGLCGQNTSATSHKLPRDFRDIYGAIINYLKDDVIPSGPGPVNGESPEAKQYTELTLLLCYFAECYEIDDLANRSIDALRAHEYQCNRTLRGRHFGEVYTNTRLGSKLRHYCALSTACFISNGEGTDDERGAVDVLLRGIPGFEDDVRAALAIFSEKTKAPKPDCDSPENHFGSCEFHTHHLGDICHVALASIDEGRRIYIGSLPATLMTEDDLIGFFKGYTM
jgi:hypothetical protein